jgi:hypothetical protein
VVTNEKVQDMFCERVIASGGQIHLESHRVIGRSLVTCFREWPEASSYFQGSLTCCLLWGFT